MHRERVQSQALRSVGYDPRRRILEIEFAGGNVYRYADVDEDVYTGLMTAASLGEYFSRHIRDAGYEYEQADG